MEPRLQRRRYHIVHKYVTTTYLPIYLPTYLAMFRSNWKRRLSKIRFRFFSKLLTAVYPSKSAPIDTKLGPKRVSDEPRHFIFRRTKKVFVNFCPIFLNFYRSATLRKRWEIVWNDLETIRNVWKCVKMSNKFWKSLKIIRKRPKIARKRPEITRKR